MIVVCSVHADDGIFSCGEFIARQLDHGEPVTVLSLCSIPPGWVSAEDQNWQDQLNVEHLAACNSLGALPAFGGFVDGKWLRSRYGREDTAVLERVLSFLSPTAVLIPLGIGHADHHYFAELLEPVAKALPCRVAVFEDLPYRVMYPEEAAERRSALVRRTSPGLEPTGNGGYLVQKLAACRKYVSQWTEPDGDAVRCCSVPERIWWVR